MHLFIYLFIYLFKFYIYYYSSIYLIIHLFTVFMYLLILSIYVFIYWFGFKSTIYIIIVSYYLLFLHVRCIPISQFDKTVPSMCVYTVITNGFSSCHRSCTIQKSRGQRYPCHFLCQRSWVTCGKDIDQGRLIYVPAIVSTVDFLFLFMSCALFRRSRICVR